LLEKAYVAHDIKRFWKFHNRVANQLAGSMPGEFSPAIDFDDLGAIIWALRVLSSFPGCVYAAVFKQNDGVWPGLGNYFFMDLALKPKPVVVSNEIRVEACN
jgi:hypothetical protein